MSDKLLRMKVMGDASFVVLVLGDDGDHSVFIRDTSLEAMELAEAMLYSGRVIVAKIVEVSDGRAFLDRKPQLLRPM